MKYKFFLKYIGIIMMGILVYSCETDIEIPGGDPEVYSKVYMSEAVRNTNNATLRFMDSVQQLVYGASFGGYGYPESDINVKFEINASVLDSFNLANNTDYSLLPSNAYTLSNEDAVIKKGLLATDPLFVKVNPSLGMEVFKKYVLPISIAQVDENYLINKKLNTTFYVIQASLEFSDFSDFDRSSWTIYGVSSEEPGEGPTNGGLGTSAIDGRLESFWHTKWAGGFAQPPHWLTIDMNEEKELHGLVFYGRQSGNDGKPRDVIVSTSIDGNNWTEVAQLHLENSNNEQRFFLNSFSSARYFKINVESNYGNTPYTHLAEVYAF